MAAPLGYKDFTTGEVLTANDVDGYLMQGIWVFASAAARDAAVTSPQEGNACYLKDTDVIQVYSGSAWATQSASNPISANIVDAKGDLIAATAADTVSRLAVGANDTVLTADSSTPTGLKWAAPAGGGGMTLLSTTTLSGASTTISGISGSYKSLKIYITGVTNNTADGKFSIKYNNETNDSYISVCETGTFTSYQNDFYKTVSNVDRTNGNIAWDLTIFNYADTTYPNKSVLGNFTYFATGVVMKSGTIAGTQYKAAAITSLVFANTGGNFSAGTVLLYGVN